MLEKAGGLPSRRVDADIPGPWLPAGTKRGGKGKRGESKPYPQSGAFGSVKVLIFLAGQPSPDMPCRLSGRRPANQTHARWVSRLCVDRLSVLD